MADALISSPVGGAAWAVSAGLIAYCSKQLKKRLTDQLVPFMGVLGAFIFASQMINFSIPGTGSSGHLGGGLMLAILLGPHAALIVMTSVLAVQALFFADGGLLALGCNIFNIGFLPAFVAYPLYGVIAAGNKFERRWTAAIVAGLAGVELGALSVVLETESSGVSDLPFSAFLTVMLSIHFFIGLAEGCATAAIVSFMAKAKPEALSAGRFSPSPDARPVLASVLAASLLAGGVLSLIASPAPDGLEWSVAKIKEKPDLAPPGSIRLSLQELQNKTAMFPDYELKLLENDASKAQPRSPEVWPQVSAGRSASGVVGGLVSLTLCCLLGFLLGRKRTISSGNDSGTK